MADSLSSMARDTAQAFVEARRAAAALTEYPGVAPVDFSEAYAVQDRALALDGRAVGGWKVGRVNAEHCDRLGIDRLSGPIFNGSIVDAADPAALTMPVFAGGFAAVEAELLFRVVSRPAGPAAELSDEAILALCSAVHVGIEIASSPFAGINALGPLVTATDFGNNAGLVVGPELPDWRSRDLQHLEAETLIDGLSRGRGTLAGLAGGPIGSVRYILDHLAARELLGEAPFWVSTGAISGVHEIKPGSMAEARFDGGPTIRCGVAAASSHIQD